jgi:hypothetical protein
VIDRDRQAADVIPFRVLDVRVAPITGDGGCLVTSSYSNTLDVCALNFGCLCAASASVSVGLRVRVGAWPELHDDFAGDERPRRLRRRAGGQRDDDEGGGGGEGFGESQAILRRSAKLRS